MNKQANIRNRGLYCAIPHSVGRLVRVMAASICPCLLIEWINRDRCYVELHNKVDGDWVVKIGAMREVHAPTLRKALTIAVAAAEADLEFVWTRDYLKPSNTKGQA